MDFSILQSWIAELICKHMRRKSVTSFYLNNESDFWVCHTVGKQLSPVSFGEIGETGAFTSYSDRASFLPTHFPPNQQ